MTSKLSSRKQRFKNSNASSIAFARYAQEHTISISQPRQRMRQMCRFFWTLQIEASWSSMRHRKLTCTFRSHSHTFLIIERSYKRSLKRFLRFSSLASQASAKIKLKRRRRSISTKKCSFSLHHSLTILKYQGRYDRHNLRSKILTCTFARNIQLMLRWCLIFARSGAS